MGASSRHRWTLLVTSGALLTVALGTPVVSVLIFVRKERS
jgi:hypothetical protein